MTRIFLILPFLICASLMGEAQINLVKNGDFEQKYTCPYIFDLIKDAKYWSCIDTAYVYSTDSLVGDPNCSPEYCNICGTGYASAPANGIFYQYPRSGSGMADVAMYNNMDTNILYQRDYLMGRLSSPLTSGQSYCVTFYVVTANTASFAINNIGAYFDDGSIDTNSHCGWPHTQYTPQVVDTAVISDTLSWIKVQGSFIANGTEKYFTIGCFTDTLHTTHIRLNPGTVSYYEVDDVSVIPSNATAYAGPDQTITAGCNAYIGAVENGGGMPCYWYILGNPAAIDSGGTILVHPTDTTTYVVSMDLCGTVTTDTVTVNVAPCAGPPVASFTHTGTHTVSYTYTGVAGCVDSIKWSFGDGDTSTAIDPVHTYSASGTYSVCATVYTYCGSGSVCDTVVVSTTTSPQPSPKEKVTVYPNPVTSELNIEGARGCELRIFNMVGQEVKRLNCQKDKEVIDVSHLADGVYTIQLVNSSGEKRNFKLLKE